MRSDVNHFVIGARKPKNGNEQLFSLILQTIDLQTPWCNLSI